MKKDTILSALKQLRESSKERKFKQSVELIINFRGVDFKKPQNRVSLELQLPFPTGKAGMSKLCVFAQDKGFAEKIKGKVERVVLEPEIEKFSKKEVEQLSNEFGAFLAEGPVMLTVAKYMGQILAPKKKMPQPVSNDPAALEPILTKLSSLIKVSNNKGRFMPVVHLMVGKESNSDEELTANILTAYDAVEKALPGKQQNIRSVFLKLTMSKPVKLEEGGQK